jgi:hypothetical protein
LKGAAGSSGVALRHEDSLPLQSSRDSGHRSRAVRLRLFQSNDSRKRFRHCVLGEKALIYGNKQDLDRIFLGIGKSFIEKRNWDCYSERFAPAPVMEKFHQVFLGAAG